MSDRVAKVHRVNRGGKPRKIRLPRLSAAEDTSTPSSLPLTADATTLPAPVDTAPDAATSVPAVPDAAIPPTKPKKEWWKSPPNSKVKKTAMKIVAMRIRGFPDAEIATALGLASPSVVRGYIHRAYRNGWLTDDLDNPKDQVEYAIGHKLVRNMHEALDAVDPERRDKMTLEVAKGTLFKQFDPQPGATAPPMNVLAIQIQMPETNGMTTIRPGTSGGAPASFVDAETTDGEG